MSEPVQDVQDGPEQGFCGELFRQARTERGFSLESVAAELHLSVKQLIAIEEGRVQDLPGRVFALGYLKGYARYLGLNEAEVIADYDRVTGGGAVEKQRKLKPIASTNRTEKGKRFPFIGLLLLVGVIAAAAVVFMQLDGQKKTGEVVLPGSAQPLPVPVVAEPVVQDERTVAESAENEPVQSEAEPAAQQEVQVEESAAETPVPAVSESALSQDEATTAASEVESDGKGHLQILFSADCWLEIRDASGARLLSEVRGVDNPVDLYGEAPFSITFGAPASVEMVVYNDDAVVLEERTNSSVLRLTLPLEN